MKTKQIEPRGGRLKQKNEMRNRRQQVSPDLALELPADEAVEREARERHEAEAQEVLPTSAAALVQATLGEAGEGVMSALRVRFVRAEHDRVLFLLHTIEQRLERFLGSAAKPSAYAEALMNLSGSPEPADASSAQTKTHTRQIVAEFQSYLTAELNPLLHELFGVLSDIKGSDVHTADDLLTLLQAGEVHNQKTTSLFGVLRQLSARFPDLPALHLESPTTPQRIIVVQPLDPQFTLYWKERLACREVYGEATLPELVSLRSNTAIVVLRDAAEQFQSPEDKEAKDSCLLLAHWMEEQIPPFQEERARKPDELAFIVRRLHFGHGNPEEVIDLLNAAELIKRNQPELYVRLCGIAPAYNYGSSGTTEAGRSDLFGNVFQIALARSLEVQITSNNKANTLFHERMQGLTELNHKQQLLQHLNETQLKQLERNIKSLQKDVGTGTPTERAISGMFALIASKMYFEASLPQMLEAIQSTEWEEERERLIERLRVAGPREFIQLIDASPLEMGDDPEVRHILRDRILSAAPSHILYPFTIGVYFQSGGLKKAIVVYLDAPDELFRSLRVHKRNMKDSGTWDQVVHILWQTAPDETIASPEFLKCILEQKIRSRADIFPLLKILHAHPHITQEQWTECYNELQALDEPIMRYAYAFYTTTVRGFVDLAKKIEELSTIDDLIGTSTSFFASEAMRRARLDSDATDNIAEKKYAALVYRLYGTDLLVNLFCRSLGLTLHAEQFFQQFPKEEIPLIIQNIFTRIFEDATVPTFFINLNDLSARDTHFMRYVKDHFASDPNIAPLLAQVQQKFKPKSAE